MARDFLSDDFKTQQLTQSSGRDFLQEPESESFSQAAKLAIPRIEEDLYRKAYQAFQKTPEYLETAKSEVPGMLNPLSFHPLNRGKQLLAGLAEGGHQLLNTPHDIADYAANRLNLIPKSFAEQVPYQKDISGDINQLLGKPNAPGEALARGVGRNALSIIPATKAAAALNPLNLTAKNIAKDVLKAEKNQVESHGKRYDSIWNEAEKTGFNQVPVNQNLLSNNLSTIEKYKTPREYKSLENFILEPTLQNAQKAQSDMGVMHRKLEEKSRSGSLTSEEQALHKAALESEKHIEDNMFKDNLGNTHDELADKYKTLTNSYRENVVPYKYNEAIQKYKAKEMLPNELVNSLSKGEFAAKKGSQHPEIWLRNNVGKIGTGLGLLGGGSWLWDHIFGNQTTRK